VRFVPTEWLHAGLHALLEVRRTLQLRNPAHSLVKLMNPCAGDCLLVSSYTHPEYAESMQATLRHIGGTGLLLRGTEGEAVADPRRAPAMASIFRGTLHASYAAAEGSLETLPALPTTTDAEATANYIRDVLNDRLPVPAPVALQLARIDALARTNS